ncbi:alpha-mannosidase [Xylella taiwanensis]|uniref:Alpha-1,2-mannosidase n=1 Tax=Xylella taiwanensis TaxID=1444770 RepID=Z9JMZ5_9GAMM|nr:GH92 family glycosyl hydrolase [Xylella taiwanensis]AXI84465.1 alpha-mannosidase [Xylella taiwanensis]EWS79383.1 alpha-1,2-mannosidase [Xylella taiwanensis]MCD8455362.1 GH92 family glycosyl hydrolase [Xylella taiwanensis]MCD8457766.1 GH92 family glycosyl hydrolase [Xylella taiwanensis]MCD8459901.1 GH92 family glycosyl hydrolase [Xylella taiwanensis]
MATRRTFLQGAITLTLMGGAGYLPGFAHSRVNAWALPEDTRTQADLTRHVDVFIGSSGHGHTFPGATLPFGMVQLSPDTYNAAWDACSGYHASNGSIMGFSHTHLSGTGIGDLLDFLLMPGSGAVKLTPGPLNAPETGYRQRYDHADEAASPGYYRVRLKDTGILAELTATARTGLHRYHFPQHQPGHLLLDLSHAMQDTPTTAPRLSDVQVRIADTRTLLGGRRVYQWAKGRYIFFAMRLSRPFAHAQLYSDDAPLSTDTRQAKGLCLKAALHFPDAGEAPLLVKVGLSAVSAENALANLDAELPDFDFARVHAQAVATWEHALGRVRIETDNDAQRRIFYTSLYHSLLAPTLFSDVDGRYRGMDLEVHTLPAGYHNYSTYSLWDTYRALHPLLTLVQSERVPDLLQCLVRGAAECPDGVGIWPLQGVETGCMIGYHSAVALAEAYTKGFTGIDYAAAWPHYRARAMQDKAHGLAYYRRLGYIPSDKVDEAVSRTLEYAYDDWACAHLAAAAGADTDARLLRARSRQYRHVFNSNSGFMQPRLENGAWATPFDPRALGHLPQWHDFTESNAWQATFLNQHDLYGYMALFGGRDRFIAKLDALFSARSDLPPGAPPDIDGMVGQYAHGNEPSHHIAYLYVYAGQPYKTQAMVRRLLREQYHDARDGLSGNEDCGQMSAWFVLSALGLYAVDPVSGYYVIGSPLFPYAVLDVGQGRQLRLFARNNSAQNVYVQSLRWNGTPITRTWLHHSELAQGGTLEFEMGPRPNLAFGTGQQDLPPSFTSLPSASQHPGPIQGSRA